MSAHNVCTYVQIYRQESAHTAAWACVLYMHNDYMPIRGIRGCIHTYNIDTGRKWRITGDSTITGIDEQLTRGIGSACVIDLANLPLRPARC